MGSVSNNDLMKGLKSMNEGLESRLFSFDERLTKLNKYFIGKMVELELKCKESVRETKVLQDSLNKLTVKYDKLCEEVSLHNSEPENVPDTNKITLDDFVEKSEKTCYIDKNIIQSTVADVINQYGICSDITTVKQTINCLQQKTMTNDLIATGLPEIENEVLLQTVNNTLIKYDIVLQDTDVKSIYRLKNKNCNANSPILIELRNDVIKSRILSKQKTVGPVFLNQTYENISSSDLRKVYFKNRLTKENLNLLRECRNFARLNGFKYVWTQDSGGILIKRHDYSRPVEVSSLEQLGKLLS